MPIIVTFDIERPTSLELNRLRSAFERLGWEHLGNTAYRYPKLHQPNVVEDWFNHVVPALMLLRAFGVHLLADGRKLDKFTIDVQSSTGYDPLTAIGAPPLTADDVNYSQPSRSLTRPATSGNCGLAFRTANRPPTNFLNKRGYLMSPQPRIVTRHRERLLKLQVSQQCNTPCRRLVTIGGWGDIK